MDKLALQPSHVVIAANPPSPELTLREIAAMLVRRRAIIYMSLGIFFLLAILALVGGAIGLASARTAFMRVGGDGAVLARAGWASGSFWVLGMGSRFAFIYWITHSGSSSIAHFSAQHAITASAWTVALLAMALCEVISRSGLMAVRRQNLEGHRAFQPA